MEEYQFQPPPQPTLSNPESSTQMPSQPQPAPVRTPELPPQTPPAVPKPEPQPNLSKEYPLLLEPQKRNKVLWILSGIMALAVLFVAFVIYYGSLPEPGDTGAQAGTPEAITNLEAELQAVDLQDLGTELEDIEKELQGL